MVQWLRFHAPNAGGTGSIPGRGAEIPRATWRGQKTLKRSRVNLRCPRPGSHWTRGGRCRPVQVLVWGACSCGFAHCEVAGGPLLGGGLPCQICSPPSGRGTPCWGTSKEAGTLPCHTAEVPARKQLGSPRPPACGLPAPHPSKSWELSQTGLCEEQHSWARGLRC